MNWTSKLSLRRKLTLVIMINTVVALCVAGTGFAEYGVYRFKELRLEDLNALANILGTNSTAPPLHSKILTPRRISCGPLRLSRIFCRLSFTIVTESLLPSITMANQRTNFPRLQWKAIPADLPPIAS